MGISSALWNKSSPIFATLRKKVFSKSSASPGPILIDLKTNVPRSGEALSGWVVNVTSLVERVPFSQYAPKTKEQVLQILVSLLVLLISGRWFLAQFAQHRREREGWWHFLKKSRHVRLILPPECVTEAPMRSPLKRVTRKIKKYIKKKGKKSGKNGGMSNGGIQQYFMDDQDAYSPILSVDVDLLPEDAMPLLVFVNSRSGGQTGRHLLEAMRQNLNPLQVVDLHKTGPAPALKLFASVPNVRILVCGGDGTVGWILQALDDLAQEDFDARMANASDAVMNASGGSNRSGMNGNIDADGADSSNTNINNSLAGGAGGLSTTFRKPPVAILPLGTGNDLARVLGWGGGFGFQEVISEILLQVMEAHPTLLDRWTATLTPLPKKELSNPQTPKNVSGTTTPGGGGKSDGEKSGGDKTPGSPSTPRFGSMGGLSSGGDNNNKDDKTKTTLPPNSPQVPKSIDEHASDDKSAGSLVMGPNGQSEIVFQNYLGIGVDAQAALRFHQTRNSKPNLFFSQATNKILYGVFGAKDFLEHSMAGLHRDCLIYADGVLQDIPQEAEGIVLLNINSFAGGVRMWEKDGDFGASSMQDGLIDIVTVHGALHLGQLNWGVDKPVRICQAREVRIECLRKLPMHIDGEPWEQPACQMDIRLKNKSTMLRRTVDSRGASILQMHEALEWANSNAIISPDQKEMIMSEVHRRAEREDDDHRRMREKEKQKGSYNNLMGLATGRRHHREKRRGSMMWGSRDALAY
jgi:diacylglycerol kinase family enzyme